MHLRCWEGGCQEPLEGVGADQSLQRSPRQSARQRPHALDLLNEPIALLLLDKHGGIERQRLASACIGVRQEQGQRSSAAATAPEHRRLIQGGPGPLCSVPGNRDEQHNLRSCTLVCRMMASYVQERTELYRWSSSAARVPQ